MDIYVYLFGGILVLSYFESLLKSRDALLLGIVMSAFVLSVGLRGTLGTDTMNYINSWHHTPTLLNFNSSVYYSLCYHEPGFFIISVLLKTIYNDVDFYFLILSLLTSIALFKSIREYAYYPLLSLLLYCARFLLLRDINQIRAALAIAVVIYAIKFIENRNFKKYLLYTFLAVSIHTSTIITFPLFFIKKLNLNKKHIAYIIIAAFAVSLTLSPFIEGYVRELTIKYAFAESYTSGKYVGNVGLKNFMIYYQIMVLFAYTYFEDSLNQYKYYYLFRNLYLFSIVLMIVLSDFLVMSSRLATIYTTLEIFIIPLIFQAITSRYRMKPLHWVFVAMIACSIFYMNLNR